MTPLEWAAQFDPGQYLLWTRFQSVAWTSADLVLIFYLLRCANLARRVLGLRPHRVSYAVLAVTALMTPCLFAAGSGRLIFAVEIMITVPHFLLILYLIAANARVLPPFVRRLLGGRAPNGQR